MPYSLALSEGTLALRIQHLYPDPLHTMDYRSAAPGGRGSVQMSLPVFEAVATGLPEALDALVATSDLQGIAITPAGPLLLGEALAEELLVLCESGLLPRAARVGVLLAGDLFSSPRADTRGASGDVRVVWRAFANRFRWVAGVAGNHDLFGSLDEQRALKARVHLLDMNQVSLDGLVVGGVSGIIGKPGKPNRKVEREFCRGIEVAARGSDALVLHEPPVGPAPDQIGKLEVRDALLKSEARFVVCGHAHWHTMLAELGEVQVLNVDGRVVVLRRAR